MFRSNYSETAPSTADCSEKTDTPEDVKLNELRSALEIYESDLKKERELNDKLFKINQKYQKDLEDRQQQMEDIKSLMTKEAEEHCRDLEKLKSQNIELLKYHEKNEAEKKLSMKEPVKAASRLTYHGKYQQQLNEVKSLMKKEREEHRLAIEKLKNKHKKETENYEEQMKIAGEELNEASEKVSYFLSNMEVINATLRNTSIVNRRILKVWDLVVEARKERVAIMNKLLEEEVLQKGEPFPWQLCEICLEQFSNEEVHTPRVLACGHTTCLGCAKKLYSHEGVICPFDRSVTAFNGSVEEILPKNFTVLQMCT